MLDFSRPYQILTEQEPFQTAGSVESIRVNTIFLTATPCPVGCSMCDLHHMTLSGPTPRGSIVDQLKHAEASLGPAAWIKLYNSGNFFDANSIPREDLRGIGEACEAYDRVVIENHPKFGLRQHAVFRDAIRGRLEVAVGLETVQPRWLERIGKRVSRDDFDRYARFLRENEIDLRVFLIVGVPGISVAEAFRWARLSVKHAMANSARHVSLIPARAGAGWSMDPNVVTDPLPQFSVLQLAELYEMSLHDARGECCVTVDLWDLQSEANEGTVLALQQAMKSQTIVQAGTQTSP
ncbi:MAG: Fe-S oxidoreductase [Planctomycetota bacterium]